MTVKTIYCTFPGKYLLAKGILGKSYEVSLDTPSFRAGQILNGEDVISVIATGGGKTVAYVLPCIMKPGLAVVISPLRLMMLMCDQVARLRGYGINTSYYNTLLSDCERQNIYTI